MGVLGGKGGRKRQFCFYGRADFSEVRFLDSEIWRRGYSKGAIAKKNPKLICKSATTLRALPLMHESQNKRTLRALLSVSAFSQRRQQISQNILLAPSVTVHSCLILTVLGVPKRAARKAFGEAIVKQHIITYAQIWQQHIWGCTKGAEKASCRATVVQNAKWTAQLSRNSKVFRCFKSKPSRGREENGLFKNTLLDDCFAARHLLRPFGAF